MITHYDRYLMLVRTALFFITLCTTFSRFAFAESGVGAVALPDMGDSSSTMLSPAEERRLGEAFMRSVRQSLKLQEDPLIDAYVRSLGNLLVGFSGHHPFDFNFFVVDDKRINAFAGPGGYIGVNSGLLLATDSESELASVVAHEIAHVTQSHLLRSFESANRMSLPTAAALIAAILLGGANPQVAEAVFAAGIATNAQTQLNYSRLHEQEADRIGIETLHQAGFEPRAMPIFFERLQQATRAVESSAPEFLRTHPVTLARISDSRGRAEKFAYRQVDDSVEYHLARARMQFLYNTAPPARRVKQYEADLKTGKYRSEFGLRYGYALALTANEQYGVAQRELTQLIKQDRERIPYFAALADNERAAGRKEKSLEILRNALNLYPHDTPLTYQLAETLLDSGEVQSAYTTMLEQGRYENESPAYYQLLARAAERANATSEAHEAWAEYHYLNGRSALAIEHLRSALRNTDISFYLKSRIEARLTTLETEMRKPDGDRNGFALLGAEM